MVRFTQVIRFPPLSYPQDALMPCLSERTVHYHRRKQERYVHRTNELVRDSPFEGLSLRRIVQEADRALAVADEPSAWIGDVFEQASQAWNHALMWRSMAPPDHRRTPHWAEQMERAWYDAAADAFGSAWLWVVMNADGRPEVELTADADRPRAGHPLLVMDLWEHAYYLDYPDARADYISAWWTRLVDWSFVERMAQGVVPEELL